MLGIEDIPQNTGKCPDQNRDQRLDAQHACGNSLGNTALNQMAHREAGYRHQAHHVQAICGGKNLELRRPHRSFSRPVHSRPVNMATAPCRRQFDLVRHDGRCRRFSLCCDEFLTCGPSESALQTNDDRAQNSRSQ